MVRSLPITLAFAVAGATLVGPSASAQGSLFTAVPVEETNFVLVAAPIGQGESSQLNIYEQRTSKRPCFAVSGSAPAVVDPLLATFDFTGICNRYIDGNGYSLRIGGDDFGTRYRLAVVKTKSGRGADCCSVQDVCQHPRGGTGRGYRGWFPQAGTGAGLEVDAPPLRRPCSGSPLCVPGGVARQ